MRVQFTGSAQVQGKPYYRGNVVELPDDVAEVYIRVGQAERYQPPKPAATPPPGDSEAEDETGDTPPRKTVRRGNRRAKTAAKSGGEQR